MKSVRLVVCLLVSAFALAACGERDQSLANKRGPVEEKTWQGAKNAYVTKGWTPGDKTSWQNQVRTRGQYQNEYVKTN